MKDYNMMGTNFTNKIALSLQPGRENEVSFSETRNASDRFLQLAETVSDIGYLGWQISADVDGEFSNVVFASTGVNATPEDYNWIFKNCAISKPDRVSCLKNLYEESQKIYVLS